MANIFRSSRRYRIARFGATGPGCDAQTRAVGQIMRTRCISASLRLLLLLLLPWLVAVSCLAREGGRAAPQPNEWSGWWFLYHRDAGGKFVLDKFTVAVVVNDVVWADTAPVTGMWSGCVWVSITRLRYGKNSVSLTYTPPGERTVTFRMTRTGPDEAEGIFSDQPGVAYLARREREHGSCAGYNP